MTLGVKEACDTIGVSFTADELRDLLERMGYGVENAASGPRTGRGEQGDRLAVSVPAWRNDVMHPVDLIEDVAVAFGYERITPELVPTFTVGSARMIEEHSATARKVLTGLGFHQVMTLVLTSERSAFEKWRLPQDGELAARAVRIDNPISTEQTICRVNLLPGLLETLAINKQYDLPQCLFEAGDCSFVDESAETGAREERFVAAAMIGTHIGYADIRAACDAFAHEMESKLEIRPTEHASFLPGRAAALFRVPPDQSSVRPPAADDRSGPRPRAADAAAEQIGIMGEVHPEVLESYGLKHPVSVLELSLAKLV